MDASTTMSEERGHLHLRLPEAMKRRIEDAARVRGQTVTDFVRGAVLDRAEEVLEQERRLCLSEEGMRAFLAVLDNPPEPNEKLKRLMAG